MINIILIVIIVIIAFFGVKSLIKRFHGESCCSSGSSLVKIEPADKNKKNYQYAAFVKIEGMNCKNCSLRIQNKLNENGMWAKVNLKKKNAVILLKEQNSEEKIKKIITDLGYKISDYKEKK